MKPSKVAYHRDGTITYWSVHDQQWRRTRNVPDSDIAAMPSKVADRVIRHLQNKYPEEEMGRKKKSSARKALPAPSQGPPFIPAAYRMPPAKPKSKGPKGPSKALVKATGAVTSARKAAKRAGEIAKAEPTRVAVGTIAGAIVGKVGADMLHSQAVKRPDTIGKYEAAYSAGAAGIAAAAGIAVAMVGQQSEPKRYAVQALSHTASFMLGSANAQRNMTKPVTATPPAATSGTDDPFALANTGAGRHARAQRRRQAVARHMASRLKSEDPTDQTTAGPDEDLINYCAGVLDDAIEDVEGVSDILMSTDDGDDETGAAGSAVVLKLLRKLMQQIKKQEPPTQLSAQPMTETVLELEGYAPEEIETGRRPAVLRSLRKERRELKREARRDARAARKAGRQERREARKERREEKKAWRAEKPLSRGQERRVARQEARIAELREDEVEPRRDDQVLILSPSEDDVEVYGRS